MNHSEACNSFESCDQCYRTLYSVEAVIAQLEREEQTRLVESQLQELEYERSEERNNAKREWFKNRFGIDAFMVKVTEGERKLRQDKRLGKWRVREGEESRLRNTWTVVS